MERISIRLHLIAVKKQTHPDNGSELIQGWDNS
jgi:hypothetical protein